MILNKEQQEAINSKDRFIFLLAGAGTGKTRTVIEKIKHLLINETSPNKILAITFTRKATEEMKFRLQNDEVTVNTFHGFCYDELKKSGFETKIIDPLELPFTQSDLLKVSTYKNSLKGRKPPLIIQSYENYLKQRNLIDFDDIMIKFLEIKDKYKTRFEYVFIDEFQDTNNIQYEILKMLINKNTKVFAVGDPDQSIYRFRGAKPAIIELYLKEYQATLLTLSLNYRSSQKIIKEANYLISLNKNRIKKWLVANQSSEGELNFLEFNDLKSEALFLINELKLLLNSNYKLDDVAVIYRNHSRATTFKRLFYENYISIISPNINMLSAHESKGLEFKVVFIIGLEDGLFPSNYENRISEIEEERRLFFVAMTRAKEKLYITYTKKDQFGNQKKISKFIKDLNRQTRKIS